MREYKNLKVWDKSHELVLTIYTLTKTFPKDETYGIISQMRRAAVSIPNNIAEGCGRKSKKELSNFLNIALGSAMEVDYLLLLSKDLEYFGIEYEELKEDLLNIRKMLNVLKTKIDSDIKKK